MVEQENEAETLARRIWSLINGNKIKSIIVLLILAFLLCLLLWFIEDDGEFIDDTDINQTVLAQLFPEQATDPILRTGWTSDNFRINVNLSYQHPADWTKTTATTEDLSEYGYLRSPKDANGFYYCVDLLEHSLAATINLDMEAEVVDTDPTFTSDGIFKPLNRLEYASMTGFGGFHTTVIDDTSVATGDSVMFSESITNPEGRRLQILGQYNCDETEKLDFTLAEYQNGIGYLEGLQMMHSIQY